MSLSTYHGSFQLRIQKIEQEMLVQGVIKPITSPYASPIVLVGKKDERRKMKTVLTTGN